MALVIKDKLTFDRFQKKAGKTKTQLLSKPDGSCGLLKTFYSNKQAEQNESNLILL